MRTDKSARLDNRRGRRGRAFLMATHLWLGLSLGTLLVFIGLSGSALIFRYELERLVFPALTHSSIASPGHAVNLDACMHAAQAVNPLKTVRSVRLPVQSDGTLEWLTVHRFNHQRRVDDGLYRSSKLLCLVQEVRTKTQ